ncbi:MAG: Mur ligase family protein [Cyclobacteriaceae bacterium]|nr:Mur ligase family protein [Cyclobacteriaceae bacterium]
MSQKIHLIAIGGAAMHALAIALKNEGNIVSGSDDELFEPAKSNLSVHGLLPNAEGWYAEKINKELDLVIVGMHAKNDNPELIKAKELNLPIFSFPQYLAEKSKNKQRIVIGGSHGKTTITAIIMHVLKSAGKDFDYLCGAPVQGFENHIKLSDAPTIVIEGDEYPSSTMDLTPKFLQYNHHIGIISGISWDHINIYKDEKSYISLFEQFADKTPKGGSIIFNSTDSVTNKIGSKDREDVNKIPYQAQKYEIKDGKVYLKFEKQLFETPIFGKHNMENISAAYFTTKRLGVTDEQFYKSLSTFKGAQNRLELLNKNDNTTIYKDFAHAPSKVLATVNAVKELFPKRQLTACFELHTFSSLTKEFLSRYKNTLNQAEKAIIFYNPKSSKLKKLPELNTDDILKAFNHPDLTVVTETNKLSELLLKLTWKERNLLLMSSGNFGNLDLKTLSNEIA